MEIVNKVAQSGLITVDLDDYYPTIKRVSIDLKNILFQGLILREKDLREYIATTDFSFCKDAYIALNCSTDAVLPTWAFMLVSIHLQPLAKRIFFGNLEMVDSFLFEEIIENLNIETYKDRKIIIKGCSKHPVPVSAFVALSQRLKPIAKSIMYGEPCSTVPLYKIPKQV